MISIVRAAIRQPRTGVRCASTRRTIPAQGPRGSFRRSQPPPRKAPTNRVTPSRETDRSHLPPDDLNHQDASSQTTGSSKVEAVSKALSQTPNSENNLITPVHIPEDPHGVLKENHPAMRLLDNSAIIIQRQLEMMNVLLGFEQANRYVIMDPHGNHIGYLAERDHGMGSAIARQMVRTHRSFTTHVFDREEKEILRFHRPFSWISSRIRVYDATSSTVGTHEASTALQDASAQSIVNHTSANVSSLPLADMRIIGSAEQEWAPLRRKYNLFLARALDDATPGTPRLTSGDLPISESRAITVAEGDSREIGMVQFARVDEPFLSWDFSLLTEDKRLIGSVNRNFAGFAREIFTDTGVYALRMDAAGVSAEPSHLISHTGDEAKHAAELQPGMTLDQRAVMLATAVSVDFDYFSRHSGSGGFFPLWMPWFGGEAAGGAAAGEAAAGAGAVGAAGEAGIATEAGAAARGLGSAEGWAAGAGTMAGYDAMQRSRGNGAEHAQQVDPQSPQAADQSPSTPYEPYGQDQEVDVWGQQGDPEADARKRDSWGSGWGDDGTSGGGGAGGGFDIDVDEWF